MTVKSHTSKTGTSVHDFENIYEEIIIYFFLVTISISSFCKMIYSRFFDSCYLEDFLKDGLENGSVPDLEFEQLPFNHPMFIMYSSGTTGAPKCMVHSTGVSVC